MSLCLLVSTFAFVVPPLSQFVHHLCQCCSVGSVCDVGDANAYPPDQSRPKRAMWMMQKSNLSWNIHHVQCGPDECHTSRAWEGKVKGCQQRSLSGELNKCFMNFKQPAVCPPAVLKDQRFKKKKRVQADRRNLHIFAFILKHVNLPPSLRSVFTVPMSLYFLLLSPLRLYIGTK